VVLGYSRLLWLRFSLRQDMRALLSGLEAAFGFFGGVPRELLFDQMKSVVTRDERLDGGKLLHNAEFLRFSAHWRFTPRACRPYRAKTKGRVERPVRYLRDSFSYGRDFANDEDLNQQAERWLGCTANVRIHGSTKERPIDRFERDERAALQPLAQRPYRSLVLLPAASQKTERVQRAPSVAVEHRPLSTYSRIAGGAP
jgi:transposase